MSKWSQVVKANAIEIDTRFTMKQDMKAIAKVLKLPDQEAKELELTLKHNLYMPDKSAEKLRANLNVSIEDIAKWKEDFARALFRQAWQNAHGVPSAEIERLIEQTVKGSAIAEVNEFRTSILLLLQEQEQNLENSIQAKLLPDSAFPEFVAALNEYAEMKNNSPHNVQNRIEPIESGIRYRSYELRMTFNKPKLNFELVPDMNFEGFLIARASLKAKSGPIQWQGGIFATGPIAAEGMAKWVIDQFVQNVDDTLRFADASAKLSSTAGLEDLRRELTGLDQAGLESAAGDPRFQSQIQQLEHLLGVKASSYGGCAGVRAFALVSLANEAVERLQGQVRENGFILLRGGTVRDRSAPLLLFPFDDKYAALQAVQTRGGSHNTDYIIQWLKNVEMKNPFVITGLGDDFIEGKFTNPVADGKKLAKLIYDFCPDVVDQGTRTLAALAKQIETSQILFLWWD